MLNTHYFIHLIDRLMINHLFASDSSVQPAQMKSRWAWGPAFIAVFLRGIFRLLFRTFSAVHDFVLT